MNVATMYRYNPRIVRDPQGRFGKRPPSCFVHLLIIAFVLTMIAYFFRAKTASSTDTAPVIVPPAAAAELPAPKPAYKPVVGRTFHVTAYTSRPEETDDTPCLAASGMDICQLNLNLKTVPADGICASNDYPFGTRLLVDNLGVCIVLDRMNSRYTGKNHLDWYFGNDLAAAMDFGKQDLSVIKL